MADKVVCMNHGHVDQVGTPQELYFKPQTKFVASFIGTSNFFSADEAQALFGAAAQGSQAVPQTGSVFMVRPEELGLQRRDASGAVIEDITFLGKVSQARSPGAAAASWARCAAPKISIPATRSHSPSIRRAGDGWRHDGGIGSTARPDDGRDLSSAWPAQRAFGQSRLRSDRERLCRPSPCCEPEPSA